MAWYDSIPGASTVKSGVGLVTGIGGTAKDAFIAPNSYDANGHLADSEKKAGSIYDWSMANANLVGAAPAPTADIKAQQIAAPDKIVADTIAVPGAIAARDVATSGLVSGPQADAIRQQTLDQAANAATSPSSAAAQMRAAGAQIQQQQLGQAAMARGADRAGARRAAMLATGQQGLAAAGTTAALAAQEQAQKQAAYTSALQGVRSGDVSIADAATRSGQLNQAADIATGQVNTQNQLAAAKANQEAGLQAQTATGAQRLTAAQGNQVADLQAQTGTIQNKQAGWQATQQAKNNFAGTALQSVGAQNQAQGVAANYGANQNEVRQKTSGGLVSGIASAFGLSDERAKTDVSPIGGGSDLDSLMGSTHGTSSYSDLAQEFGTPQTGPTVSDRLAAGFGAMGASLQGRPAPMVSAGGVGQNFLDWRMPQRSVTPSSGGGAGLGGLVSAVGGSGLLSSISDERAKRDVERMGDKDVANWAEAVPTAVWRFKSGVPGTDGGEEYHTGTLAGGLEKTGPLGKLMVHRRDDGLREVEYGPLGLMVGKGALSRANEAMDWAKAAFSLASGRSGKGLAHG